VINDRTEGDRWWKITWPDKPIEEKGNRNIMGTLGGTASNSSVQSVLGHFPGRKQLKREADHLPLTASSIVTG
jgi:hypothetical protein